MRHYTHLQTRITGWQLYVPRQLSHLLERLSTLSVQLVVTGDIDIRLDRPDDTHTLRFNVMLTSVGLVQYVREPKYNFCGILNIVITKTDWQSSDVSVKDVGLADNFFAYRILD